MVATIDCEPSAITCNRASASTARRSKSGGMTRRSRRGGAASPHPTTDEVRPTPQMNCGSLWQSACSVVGQDETDSEDRRFRSAPADDGDSRHRPARHRHPHDAVAAGASAARGAGTGVRQDAPEHWLLHGRAEREPRSRLLRTDPPERNNRAWVLGVDSAQHPSGRLAGGVEGRHRLGSIRSHVHLGRATASPVARVRNPLKAVCTR
jgi:hypothetical protein